MKRTFMRTKLKTKGKFSMFRQEGFTSIWLTLCCTNGSHVERRTNYPKPSLAYKPSPQRQVPGPWISLDHATHPGYHGFRPFSTPETAEMNDSPATPSKSRQRPVSKGTPVFVSIERCPPVVGTRRKIFTMGTYHPSNLTATLLDYGYYTSLCTYYDEEPSLSSPFGVIKKSEFLSFF